MKILILGNKGSGKTTAAKILKNEFGLEYSDSSDFCCEKIVYPALKDKYGYKSWQECQADVDNHRVEWEQEIFKYNTPNRDRVAKELLEFNDVYAGMRNHLEYEASAPLFDLKLWVDASIRNPTIDESMSIPYSPIEMGFLDNNRGKAFLRSQIYEYVPDYLMRINDEQQ